ncbi:OsmC family protein [Actinomadura rugatobispora]|uniref:OsmC family protein n=1 Tax=Actinomadura rugatobispora TaxID=1994 RepID=A0ABW1A162_9ACTN|nr:hypothetical protein GCM10010200_106310 [Actinomadura rugatobispora]
MDDISVIHREDDAFAILIRDHVIHIDQPFSAGGMDAGPTPVEVFVAGLAACAAHYGRRYLASHGLPAQGLAVSARFTMNAASPARIARIDLSLRPPVRLPEAHEGRFRAAVERCTLHNTLLSPPQVEIDIGAAEQVA